MENIINPRYSDQLLKKRVIFLNEQINPITSRIIIEQLLLLSYEDSNKDITIYINCPGGSVSDGLAIYDTINYLKCDVTTICIGMAASMAAVLLASGTKGKRYILPHSEVMIHEIQANTAGAMSSLISSLEHAKRNNDKLIEILANVTNKEQSLIKQDMIIDKWFNAQEALEYGLVDKIIE
ncbi:MAG: ATP-dependent Clp protease proteolytic subunit [Bacilli bacterium]|jgi:ATP-dependent Clp protease protease subunit|nr:ATP-dependent Clp protease proteolytic subunit [Bacilli bacterium]